MSDRVSWVWKFLLAGILSVIWYGLTIYGIVPVSPFSYVWIALLFGFWFFSLTFDFFGGLLDRLFRQAEIALDTLDVPAKPKKQIEHEIRSLYAGYFKDYNYLNGWKFNLVFLKRKLFAICILESAGGIERWMALRPKKGLLPDEMVFIDPLEKGQFMLAVQKSNELMAALTPINEPGFRPMVIDVRQ